MWLQLSMKSEKEMSERSSGPRSRRAFAAITGTMTFRERSGKTLAHFKQRSDMTWVFFILFCSAFPLIRRIH